MITRASTRAMAMRSGSSFQKERASWLLLGSSPSAPEPPVELASTPSPSRARNPSRPDSPRRRIARAAPSGPCPDRAPTASPPHPPHSVPLPDPYAMQAHHSHNEREFRRESGGGSIRPNPMRSGRYGAVRGGHLMRRMRAAGRPVALRVGHGRERLRLAERGPVPDGPTMPRARPTIDSSATVPFEVVGEVVARVRRVGTVVAHHEQPTLGDLHREVELDGRCRGGCRPSRPAASR